MDAFRRLLAALGLRTREAAVPRRDASEPALAGAELRARAVLHPLDLQLGVLVAEGAVTADTLGHLHGGRPSVNTEGKWYLSLAGSASEKLVCADRNRDRRHRALRAAEFRRPRGSSTVESQQIYIAKLINGGEIQ